MQLLSYSQNNEDILLWRALKHVEKGFYIDVGANHPVDDSVTKLFYENGWSGINIEPVPEKLEELKKDRPRDINLGSLVGSNSGSIFFYEIPEDTRLSTTDEETARRHAAEYGYNVKIHQMNFESLDSICRKNNTGIIHFLKIDVEGCEGDVISSINFDFIKPWIIVVESTLPCSDEAADVSWETTLKNAEYEFVFFDGLSRYYISHFESHLKKYFTYPAGIHDSFITIKEFKKDEKIRQLESRVESLKIKQADIYSSISWKITKPLRFIHNQILRFQGKSYFHE
jgi:FkbM family methyltransferase